MAFFSNLNDLIMKANLSLILVLCSLPVLLAVSCSSDKEPYAGTTEILKWKDGKRAAISLTYDDGTINQFRVAAPLMEQLGFRGTFFINTGQIPGSEFQARFIGRPLEEIIRETATIPTTPENLFERASVVGFLGYPQLLSAHTRAGSAVDAGNLERACRIIDEAYARVRAGEVDKVQTEPDYFGEDQITWEEISEFADRGHEFANHTISHPRLAILDEANLLWELEKCKEDILNRLGPKHTFSCECPYGTENERVMEYAYEIHPALRNRMPEDYLKELNRSSRLDPGTSDKSYVQWQRGPLSDTPLELMKSWVDTCMAHNHIWLVLVFHGVDGVGWEAIPGDTLENYFGYMKSNEADLWVATFQDVTKYMRERMAGEVKTTREKDQIQVQLSHNLDPGLYDMSLSLKTSIPDGWEAVQVSQDGAKLDYRKGQDESGTYIIYEAAPNQGPVIIEKADS